MSVTQTGKPHLPENLKTNNRTSPANHTRPSEPRVAQCGLALWENYEWRRNWEDISSWKSHITRIICRCTYKASTAQWSPMCSCIMRELWVTHKLVAHTFQNIKAWIQWLATKPNKSLAAQMNQECSDLFAGMYCFCKASFFYIMRLPHKNYERRPPLEARLGKYSDPYVRMHVFL